MLNIKYCMQDVKEFLGFMVILIHELSLIHI